MTKEIPLSIQGKNRGRFVAQVDDEDFARVSKYRWAATQTYPGLWYASRKIRTATKWQNRYLHQEILTPLPGMMTDHIDGNGLNCQRSNLRSATAKLNGQNKHRYTRRGIVRKPMDEPTTTTIVFPKATYKLLKQQAKDTDRSVGSLVRLAVDSYLQRIQEQGEPYPDTAQPPAAAQKAKAGKG